MSSNNIYEKNNTNNKGTVEKIDINNIDINEIILDKQNIEEIIDDDENKFLTDIKEYINKNTINGEINWNNIFEEINNEINKKKSNSVYQYIFAKYKIESAENLKNLFAYLSVQKFIEEQGIDIYNENYNDQAKLKFFNEFKKKFQDSFIFYEKYDFGVIETYDDMRILLLNFEYNVKLDRLTKKISGSNQLGVIGSAMLDNKLVNKNNAINILYDDDVYVIALYETFKKNKNTNIIINEFNIKNYEEFRRIFFPAPANKENEFIDMMYSNYNWEQFDDIGNAFLKNYNIISNSELPDNKNFVNWIILGKKMCVFDKKNINNENPGSFSIKEQKQAFNKFMQISNLTNIDEINLETRRKAFVEILYRERILKNLGIEQSEIPPLSMIALRNNLTTDDAEIVPGYRNIFYIPNISFFYRAILEAHISKKIWGTQSAIFYDYLAISAYETNMKDLLGDKNYGGSKGPVQMNTGTIKSLQHKSPFKNYFKILFPSGYIDKNNTKKKYVFEAPANSRAPGFFTLMYLKGFNGENETNRLLAYRKYNGLITKEIRENMIKSGKEKVLKGKIYYPKGVMIKYKKYIEFANQEREIRDKLFSNYQNIYRSMYDTNKPNQIKPGFDRLYGVGYLTFIKNFLAGREKFEITIDEGNQVFQQSIKRIFNPDLSDDDINELIYDNYSLVGLFLQNISNSKSAEGMTIKLQPDKRDFHVDENLSNISDVNGTVYIKYKKGDPKLENTIFQYLRGNLDSGILYHNQHRKEGDPYYKIIPVNGKKWVKVYESKQEAEDDFNNTKGQWDKDILSNGGFLKLYIDTKKPVNRYPLGAHGQKLMNLFVENDDGEGNLIGNNNDNNGNDINSDILSSKKNKLEIHVKNYDEILFFGDDLIQGLNYNIGNTNKITNKNIDQKINLNNKDKVNIRGTPGETITQGYKKLKNKIDLIENSGVKYLFLSYTTSDKNYNNEYINNVQGIIDLCNEKGIKIIFLKPFAGPGISSEITQKIWNIADQMEGLQKNNNNFYLIDYTKLLDDNLDNKNIYYDNGKRFKPKYYYQILENILMYISTEE